MTCRLTHWVSSKAKTIGFKSQSVKKAQNRHTGNRQGHVIGLVILEMNLHQIQTHSIAVNLVFWSEFDILKASIDFSIKILFQEGKTEAKGPFLALFLSCGTLLLNSVEKNYELS